MSTTKLRGGYITLLAQMVPPCGKGPKCTTFIIYDIMVKILATVLVMTGYDCPVPCGAICITSVPADNINKVFQIKSI